MRSMSKKQAAAITGGLTQTTKMPCRSYSLPTVACKTGFRMSKIAGSICAVCYASRGNYMRFAASIEPAQHARLESIDSDLWVNAMVTLIGTDQFFRWHDSGDIRSIDHLEKIAQVCELTPNCKHWLATREYGIVAAFAAQHDIPPNLVIRLSAMFPDRPAKIPASLRGIAGIAVSHVHTVVPLATPCNAPNQRGECRECRACWDRSGAISYAMH